MPVPFIGRPPFPPNDPPVPATTADPGKPPSFLDRHAFLRISLWFLSPFVAFALWVAITGLLL